MCTCYNIYVNSFSIWTCGSGGDVFKDISIFRSDGHFVQRSGTIRGILVNGIMGNILMKYYVVCENSIKYSASSHLISFPQLV